MDLLVTIARYRAITGDTATPSVTVSAKLEEAQEMLVDALGRELVEAEYTETLVPTRDGYVWPSVTPITDPGSYTLDGDGLVGSFGPGWLTRTSTVETTYRGGWVARGTPDATNWLPGCIERDLAYAAKALIDGAASSSPYPAGAVSVRLGDAAINFGPDGAPRPGGDNVQWSRRTLGYRARTVRGTTSSVRGLDAWA